MGFEEIHLIVRTTVCLLGWPSFVSFKHSAYLTFQVTQVYFTASRDVIYRILIKCTRGRILITTVGITYALLLSLLVLSS